MQVSNYLLINSEYNLYVHFLDIKNINPKAGLDIQKKRKNTDATPNIIRNKQVVNIIGITRINLQYLINNR